MKKAFLRLLVPLMGALGVYGGELGPPPRYLPDREPVARVMQTAAGLTVNTEDRAAVIRFFGTVYRASEEVEIGWNGDVKNCLAGVNSQAYKDATVLRLNFFRAMAGLPADVTLDETLNVKCQQAALMMAAKGSLSHNPPATWTCYSAAGAEAAGKANLYLGTEGPLAIDGYMDDIGGANYFVGHRRWIIYPPQKTIGTGSIPRTDQNWWSANALWVIGNFGARPAEPVWVAWPPKGYIPYQILPRSSGRWSFAYPKAKFTDTTVSVRCSGTNVPVTLEIQANDIGYGDNTLVWVPQGLKSGPPAADLTYTVTLNNVVVNSQSQVFTYDVTIIDPEPMALSIQSSGDGRVEIFWPTNPPGWYHLWGNPTPGTSGGWLLVYPSPKIVGSNYSVILNATRAGEFFRLQKP